MALQKTLLAAGSSELPYIEQASPIAGGTIYRTTQEHYLGFLRGVFGNPVRMSPNNEQAFDLPKELEADIPYLKGHWHSEKDAIVHDRALSGMQDSLVIRYHGFTVDAVMERRGRKIPAVHVTLDGRPIPEDMMGEDLEKDGDNTVCKVKDARLYQLVNSEVYHGGTLAISTKDRGLALYTLSFGSHPGRL